MDNFLKSFKTFATFDIDDNKETSSVNSFNFDDLTKIYVHSSGGRKSQTAPTDISLLRPRPEASKHLSYIFGRFDIHEGKPFHLPVTELFLRYNDCQANTATQVIIKFIRDPGLILADLEHRMGIENTHVVPIRGVIFDEKIPKLKYDGHISTDKQQGF